MSPDLAHVRESYEHGVLRRADLDTDPFVQFGVWWDQWMSVDRYDAAACILATANAEGRPSARYVLCRRFGPEGFELYTNLGSAKARDLGENPHAALVFGWLAEDRQVRIEGPVSRVADDVADAYWASRPRGSQLGGWASEQSEVLEDRAELERHRADVAARFGGDDGTIEVPRPPFWGGYLVGVDRMEFWQGRPDRLHDRFEYRRRDDAHDAWVIDRLSP